MKVVLFCGGLGMRLKEYSENIPKPLVNIGYRPIIWHLMKYYSYYGHKDFILCLGYRGDLFKRYFLDYDDCESNDFTLLQGGKKMLLRNHDIKDWNITFADTGIKSNLGQRLLAVKKYLHDEEIFLANYSDGLTDLNLADYIKLFLESGKIGAFISVKPTQSFHIVTFNGHNEVADIKPIGESDIWLNGGYFIFKKDIFRYVKDGEELVSEPFKRLIKDGQLMTFGHKGFWLGMDTFKDKQLLDDMYSEGNAPWELWNRAGRRHQATMNGSENKDQISRI